MNDQIDIYPAPIPQKPESFDATRLTVPHSAQVFSIPLNSYHLVYSPLHHLAGLVEQKYLPLIVNALSKSHVAAEPLPTNIRQIIRSLKKQILQPSPPNGKITHPLFLGFITTWKCNLGCLYCDFVHADTHVPAMSMETAKAGLDYYFDVLASSHINKADIQFFGGEPFLEKELVAFTVAYARKIGRQRNIQPIFEATTNGMFSIQWCRWVADNFDSITLSLDGREDNHNRFRLTAGGKESFSTVIKNARLLSESGIDLTIRMCITDANVDEMEETAAWIADQITCDTVCFESLVPSDLSKKHNLQPPDPFKFAHNFCLAERILNEHGFQTVTSGTDFDQVQLSFCPVGKDALIITPEGHINACYLTEEKWQKAGFNLNMGIINGIQQNDARVILHQPQIESIRQLGNCRKPLCLNCFCRYSCAGGCLVNHSTAFVQDQPDQVCIQTRLITLARLLSRIGAEEQWQKLVNHMQDYAPFVQENDFNILRIIDGK
jgi:uncharacterized protein